MRRRAQRCASIPRAPHLGRQSRRFDDLGLREHRRRRPLTDRPQPAADTSPPQSRWPRRAAACFASTGDALVAGRRGARTRRHAGVALRCGLRRLRTPPPAGRAIAAVEPAAVRLNGVGAAHAHARRRRRRAPSHPTGHIQRSIQYWRGTCCRHAGADTTCGAARTLRERRLADHLHAVGKGIALLRARRTKHLPISESRLPSCA